MELDGTTRLDRQPEPTTTQLWGKLDVYDERDKRIPQRQGPQFLGIKTSENYAMHECADRKERCLKKLKETILLETSESNTKIDASFENKECKPGREI